MARAEEAAEGMLMDESSLKDSSLVPSQDGARLQYIRHQTTELFWLRNNFVCLVIRAS